MFAVRAVDAEEEVHVSAQDDVVQEHVVEEVATDVVSPTPTSPSPSSLLNAARLSKFLLSGKYNMVTIFEKSDAAGGFEQIIDFLSGSYIYHALTVNPHVYIPCIKQFWNTVVVKRSGDVTRLQALVDKKRIVIFEEVVRKIL
nr:hypothetical protein [Tanacetum cinerariifolium]